MKPNIYVLLCTVLILAALAASAHAQTETLLHTFISGSDGAVPDGDLVLDNSGNLYGTTVGGGTGTYCNGCGTAFELIRNANGTWTEKVLYNFGSVAGDTDGVGPIGHMVVDSKGNLYGTTGSGGTSTYGTVFELKRGSGGGWTERALYSFGGGSDGSRPCCGLIMDNIGNLYGVAGGGSHGYGVVFELVAGANGAWTEKVLYSFAGGSDGSGPNGILVFDKVGNLYGVAEGGSHDYGVVFELTPGSNGSWTEKVLHAFSGGVGGSSPDGGVALDSAGNLYGIASYIIFELSQNPAGTWAMIRLHNFLGGSDGADPHASLVSDTAGNLYGTTASGGAHHGTVFRLTRGATGTWTEKILHRFAPDGVDGVTPGPAAVAIGSNGTVYGTTPWGGTSKNGVVFQITP